MKKLISSLSLVFIALLFLLTPAGLIAEEAKEKSEPVDVYALFWPVVPGRTITDPLFFIKQFREGFDSFFRFDNVTRSDYQLKLSEKRLVETAKLVENKDFINAIKSLEMNSKNRTRAIEFKRKAQEEEKDTLELVSKLVKSLENQQKAITFLASQFPDQQKQELQKMVDDLTLQISEAK